MRKRRAVRRSTAWRWIEFLLEQRCLFSGLNVGLVRDINLIDTSPSNVTDANGKLYFLTSDQAAGQDSFWVSDGTTSGTISLGIFDSFLDPPYVDGKPFFIADDGTHGARLWTSDGTAAGTNLVRDIDPGSASSAPQWWTDLNGTLAFVAHDGDGTNQLWKSDGTTGGTALIESFTPAQT
jgi:ELWxxDGT repeat protein